MAQTTSPENSSIRVVAYGRPTENDVTIISPSGNNLDISALVTDFKYFESIYSDFVTAKMTLLDSTGLLAEGTTFNNGCGLRKLCAITVTLNDPTKGTGYERSLPEINFAADNCFFVNRITNQLTQGKKRVYELELINRPGLVSISKQLIKAWPSGGKNIEYNQIIDDILVQDMVVSKTRNVTTDATEPVTKYQSNNYFITKVIEDACKYGVPKVQSGGGTTTGGTTSSSAVASETLTKHAGYAFFETHDAFNYVSLDSLVTFKSTDPSPDRTHTFATTIVNNSDSTSEASIQTIISYTFFDDRNTSGAVDDVLTGKLGNPSTVCYDFTKKTYTKIEQETVLDRCESITAGTSIKPAEYVIDTLYQVGYYDTCDETALDSAPRNPRVACLTYTALLEDMKSRTSNIKVPGNLSVSAGDKVSLSFQKIEGKGNDQEEFSTKYSGIYVVTGVIHHLEGVNKLFTHLEVCKLKEN